jgi:hypothetical protein
VGTTTHLISLAGVRTKARGSRILRQRRLLVRLTGTAVVLMAVGTAVGAGVGAVLVLCFHRVASMFGSG